MKFGDYIRQKREARGWTQPEAAARADIEQSYLSKLETGKSYPSEDIFNRLMSTYEIDASDMSANVFSSELDKLREIKEVRTVVLHKQKKETKLARGWLVAGLLCMMMGGACLGLVIAIPDDEEQQFHYSSKGVLLEGESLGAFDIVNDTSIQLQADVNRAFQPQVERQKEMVKRIDEVYRSTTRFRGPYFVENVEGGKTIVSAV